MKKVLLCFITVLCLTCLNQQIVNATNSYTQKEVLDGTADLKAGTTITFENDVKVTIVNFEREIIYQEMVSSMTLPDYPEEYASFAGWANSSSTHKDGKLSTISFVPYFNIGIQMNEVKDGESIVLSVDANEIPMKDYTCEWVQGGLGGGLLLEGAPLNSLTWTIDPTSPYYKNEMIIALKIENKENRRMFSEEAVLVIHPKDEVMIKPSEPDESKPIETAPQPTTPQQPTAPKKDVVDTSDLHLMVGQTMMMIVAGGLFMIVKSKKA